MIKGTGERVPSPKKGSSAKTFSGLVPESHTTEADPLSTSPGGRHAWAQRGPRGGPSKEGQSHSPEQARAILTTCISPRRESRFRRAGSLHHPEVLSLKQESNGTSSPSEVVCLLLKESLPDEKGVVLVT